MRLYKYKKKLKKRLKRVKIISGIKPSDLAVVMLIIIASWIIGAYIGTSIFSLRNSCDKKENKTVSPPIQKAELDPGINSKPQTALIGTEDWKTYRSQKYEFEIKYPKEWNNPKEYISTQESGYEYKVSFNSFDILIRNNFKTSQVPKCNNNNSDTPKYVLASYQNDYAKMNNYPAENSSCATREIHILKDKFYFKKVFVYHVIKGKYAYDIVPVAENKSETINYISALAVNENTSQLEEILPTFKFKSADPIIARMAKPRIVYAVNISCVEKNDHPSMSDTKGKHMDEDCCPDPDEWPKPGCRYSAKGYSIMLSASSKKK